jgi:hypothetical protein
LGKLPKSRAGSKSTIASFVTFDVFPGVKPNKGEPIMAFSGVFTPVLVRHSKSFSHIDCISVGVDRMEPNFKPMRKQVEARLTNGTVTSPISSPLPSVDNLKASTKLPSVILDGRFGAQHQRCKIA